MKTLSRAQAFALAPLVAQALHTGRKKVGGYQVSYFHQSIPYVDIQGYRFVVQNKQKQSEWAALARQGKRITWLIELQGNHWIGRVIDGTLTVL